MTHREHQRGQPVALLAVDLASRDTTRLAAIEAKVREAEETWETLARNAALLNKRGGGSAARRPTKTAPKAKRPRRAGGRYIP